MKHPLLENILVDTHFSQRDRMGRLVAFAARLFVCGSFVRACVLCFLFRRLVDFYGACLCMWVFATTTVTGSAVQCSAASLLLRTSACAVTKVS